MGNMNKEAKSIKVFKYDKHTFSAMLKDITKYDVSKLKMLIYLIAARKVQHIDQQLENRHI